MKIPSKMQAFQIENQNDDVEKAIASMQVVTKEVPKPKYGEVLIKVEAAPCNPSDLLFLQGKYGVKKSFPAVPGWEGAGTVVANGGGFMGMWLKGKRVACAGQTKRDGTWAEYHIANASLCIPLKKEITFEQGAVLLINPLTAVGLVQEAKDGKHAAIVQTAAASQVGRMVIVLAKEVGLPVIHIVRRKEQVDLLHSLGEQYVINSASDDFLDVLRNEAKRLNATIAFDAVAGDLAGNILNVLPSRSRMFVYGALSEKHCAKISPIGLIFEQKSVEGFLLSGWLQKSSFWKVYQSVKHVQKLMLSGQFETAIQRRCGFEDFKEGLLDYHKNMTAGKVLLTPNRETKV